MRVLMATMQLDIGGAETHIVELSKALSKMGVEVLVASNGGAYVKELQDAGIKHFRVELNKKTIGSMSRAYKALERIILDYEIDIVHAHARIPGFLCGLLSKKYNLRFVTTAHWVFDTRFPFRLLTNWGKRSLAVSDDIKKYLIDNYGSKAEDIRITINGVDTDKFSDSIDFSDVAKEFDFGENKERVVYVSRMDIDRSYAAHKLIESVPEILESVPDLEVIIVGGGNDFDKIEDEAREMNDRLGRRVVIVTGGRCDINKFAAAADVFVGVSRAALEAMACKKPAIIAGNEGYIGIFDEDKLKVSIDTNFCCRGCGETTREKLAADLLALLGPQNKETRKRLGEYSLEIVKKHYSVLTMAKDALMMYTSVSTGIPVNEVTDEDIQNVEKFLSCGCGRRSVDVAISGYYGFHNSGDDSILSAIIEELRRNCPNISVTVLSKSPAETARLYGVNAIGRLDFVRLWKLFKNTKLLISGGGSLIQDVTSSKSLYYYLAVIRLAKLRGAKVMLYANGIGPVVKKKNIKHIRKTLEKVDYITLRESFSGEELSKIMDDEKSALHSLVTADPVFTTQAEDFEAVKPVLERSGIVEGDKYFVISVREWKTLDNDFVEKICDFSKMAWEEFGVKPLVVPMQEKFDRKISQEIANGLTVPFGICPEGVLPRTMMGIIGGSEFVLGMRLHTLLYAVKMAVPSIALDYDPKVDAAMKAVSLDYSQKVEEIDPIRLMEYTRKIQESREEICKSLKKRSDDFKELAQKNAQIAVGFLKEYK